MRIIDRYPDNKSEEESSLIYHSSNTSLETAIEEASLKIDKNLFFIDLDVLLLDTYTANNKLSYIIDYLTRDVMYSTNFNIVIDDNIENTIKTINNNEKIAGEYIKDIFNNKTNNIIDNKYHNFLKSYLCKYQDIILPYGKVINNEYIINEAVIFNNNKIINKLNFEEIQLYNLLTNETSEYLFEIEYQGKKLVYKVSSHKSKINYNNKINIDIKLNGSFIEIDDINLEENAESILKVLKFKINNDISSLINKCIIYNSDIFKFKKYYYNSKREKINSINNINYEINLDILLDREGMMFNSIGDIK